ncbi:MAG: AbrB/MazE/SpoVT family DNA-binding domain-containing protein [Candidatus Korarchaeota archaeon]|nr:AbrB/MazE/SpoVT family DNA-binding domain-containing protein [Candidatus Korarchaeota archaeon]
MSEVKVRITKKFTLYIPKSIAGAAGLREGDYVRMRVEGSKVILERVPDPFELALKGPKFARITFEEFERESEEMQDALFGD